MAHLFGKFFQFGYVTRDVDAAIAQFRERQGQAEFMIIEPGIVNGKQAATRRIALTYIDDIMTEVIEPDPGQETIYDAALPAGPGPMCLHHLGFFVDDHQATLKKLSELKYEVPLFGSMDGVLDYSYADTRAELGHFCEFIRLDKGGEAFFGGVPRLTTR